MRIGTWNVEYAAVPAKNARRRELLVGADADVWVLTETNDSLDIVGERLRSQESERAG